MSDPTAVTEYILLQLNLFWKCKDTGTSQPVYHLVHQIVFQISPLSPFTANNLFHN